MDITLLSCEKKDSAIGSLAEGPLDCPCPPNCVNRNFVASPSASPPTLTAGDARLPSMVEKDKEGEEERKGGETEEKEEEEEEDDNACWGNYGRGNGRKFPPAIPLLARTGNLSCHMPWVLERDYRADGRLVIRKVRVKHHEYFRARRANGRLVLELVELDEENSRLFGSSRPQCDTESNDDDDDDEEEARSAQGHLSSSSSSPTSPSSSYVVKDDDNVCDETIGVENNQAECEAVTDKQQYSGSVVVPSSSSMIIIDV